MMFTTLKKLLTDSVAMATATCASLFLGSWKPVSFVFVAWMGVAGVAHAQVVALHEVDRETFDYGMNPTVGMHNGRVVVHFQDPYSLDWMLWEPQTGGIEISDVPWEADTCAWGDADLFCTGVRMRIGTANRDFVYAKRMLSSVSTCPEVLETFPLRTMSGVTDADHGFAAVEMADGTIYRYRLNTSSCSLTSDVVRGASLIWGSAVLLEDGAVVYQDQNLNQNLLVRWDPRNTTVWNTTHLLMPSDNWYSNYVYASQYNSVQRVYLDAGGAFDPINREYDLKVFGCDTLEQGKAAGDLLLFRGTGCGTSKSTVLFGAHEFGVDRFYRIGNLSANGSYDIFVDGNQYHIVYINDAYDADGYGKVVWVTTNSGLI